MDSWAYTNQFNKVHPLEKTLISIVTMLIVLAWEKPLLHITVLIVMMTATIIGAGIPYKVYLKYFLIPFLFIIAAIASVAIEVNGDPSQYLHKIQLFYINMGVTQISLSIALRLFLRSLAALTCLYFLAFTTPMQDIIYLLEKSHCPTIVTEIMVLMYRFVFIFLTTAKNIYYAQNTRLGYRNFNRGIRSFSTLCSVLFVKAYMQSKALYQSSLSRGYQGSFNCIENDNKLSLSRLISISMVELGLCVIGYIS